MSSLSDWRCHKASINSPSNKGGRKLRSFDDALIDYERFVFEKRTGRRGDKVVAACSLEVAGTAVRGDRRESTETSCLAHTELLEVEESETRMMRLDKEFGQVKGELETVKRELVTGAKRRELPLEKCESLQAVVEKSFADHRIQIVNY
ncbi:hypothetical protein ACOSQ2_028752 [Xanthoceras sorbifolium]